MVTTGFAINIKIHSCGKRGSSPMARARCENVLARAGAILNGRDVWVFLLWLFDFKTNASF